MRILFLRMLCLALVSLCLAAGFAVDRDLQKRNHAKESEVKDRFQQQQEALRLQKQIVANLDKLLNEQDQLIDDQNRSIDHLKEVLSAAIGRDYSGEPVHSMTVTATAYTARKEECNSQPWITASGKPSRVGAIAVSRDIERAGIKLGDLVIVKNMGLFRVEDRMNKRWSKRIDILHASVEAARNFAKREVELMWVGKS